MTGPGATRLDGADHPYGTPVAPYGRPFDRRRGDRVYDIRIWPGI